MSKFLSWLWNDGKPRSHPEKSKSPKPQQTGRNPPRSPSPEVLGVRSQEYLSPASQANLDKAQKVIREIEDLIKKELDLLAATKKDSGFIPCSLTGIMTPPSPSKSPSGSPSSSGGGNRRSRPGNRERKVNFQFIAQSGGPRLIRSLNKSKSRIVVGDMEFDPDRGVWNGNDEALNVFRKATPRLIRPDQENVPAGVTGNMVWDPVEKSWRGNEEELNRFVFPQKAKLGLITNVSSHLLSGLAGNSGMVFNAKTLQWENKGLSGLTLFRGRLC